MKRWLYIHRTMTAYCRYCTLRAEWAWIEGDNKVEHILGFFCKDHRQEVERPITTEGDTDAKAAD